MPELGGLQPAALLSLLAGGPLGVDHQTDALGKLQLGEFRPAQLGLEGLGQGRQLQGLHLSRRWRS
jgi:hypothetical protein